MTKIFGLKSISIRKSSFFFFNQLMSTIFNCNLLRTKNAHVIIIIELRKLSQQYVFYAALH